ncbi:MAG TPA: hypothetical protein VLG45_08775, partial [Thermodesulfobacteriota bacterium]|nr:hypothetical protein [Thermodesulfobacteriota bacterium]
KKQTPSFDVKGKFKAEGHIVIGNNNTIILDSSKTSLEKQVEEMEANLTEVTNRLEHDQVDSDVSQSRVNLEEYKKVLDILESGQSLENKARLRTLYYTTTDKVAQIQIILLLAEWYMPQEDNEEDLIALCDEGIALADEINAKQEKAVLLAYKGDFISIQFSNLDFETASSNLIANQVGISLTTKEQHDEVVRKLNSLYESSDKCFKEAERLAKEINSYKALGFVYRKISVAAGHRYIHLKAFGAGMAEGEKQLAKRAFRLSKNIYASANDELEIAYTYYNFANQLRNFGETEEAKRLLEEAKSIALRYNEVSLVNAANLLSDRIRTGYIPDAGSY